MVKIASGEDAWRYFLESVAVEAGRGDAVDYYAARGTPAGRWYGAGVAGLGVAEGRTVTPAELSHLYGAGAHPLTGEPLARRYVVAATLDERVDARVKQLDTSLDDATREHAVAKIIAEETAHTPASSVAGFELVFNPPKSVSVLWALAPTSVQELVKAAHEQALQETLAILERDALRTRAGAGGVAQLEVLGAVATGFDHWDSRDGDPQLHTHLLIANRVQTPDGRWRTIDSRLALSPHVVTLSETYDAALMDALSNRLGLEWTERKAAVDERGYARFLQAHGLSDSQEAQALFADASGVAARNRKWEIAGIPPRLLDEFSQRSTAIAKAKDDLIEEYRAATGKEPSRFQVWRMRSQATRRTRAAKTVRSLEQLSEDWRERAARITDPDELVADIVRAGSARLAGQGRWSLRGDDLADALDMQEVAGRVLARLAEARATWTRANAMAEIHRALKPITFRSVLDRDDASRRVLERVIDQAVAVTPRNPLHAPREFRQSDGASAFAPTSRELFTTQRLLEAERRLLDAASRQGIAGHALRLGAMRENPALGVKAPSVRRTKMRIPTVDEVRALRLALRAYDQRPVKRGDAMHDLADIGDFLIGTGCRIGEALALRWKSVDLSRGVVVLSATVVRVAGQGLVVQDFPQDRSFDSRAHAAAIRARHACPSTDRRILRAGVPVRHRGAEMARERAIPVEPSASRLRYRLDHTQVRTRGGRDTPQE